MQPEQISTSKETQVFESEYAPTAFYIIFILKSIFGDIHLCKNMLESIGKGW